MLIANIAYNFFKNILKSHKTHDLAKFIYDERKMRLTLKEGFKLIFKRRRLWHKPWLRHNFININFLRLAASGVKRTQEIF